VAGVVALVAALVGGMPPAGAEDKAVKQYTFTDTRDKRFGEILVVKPTGIEIYNTTGLNDCPAEQWNALDLEKLRKEFGAVKVQKNGPHY
jgi:hypothetical protein